MLQESVSVEGNEGGQAKQRRTSAIVLPSDESIGLCFEAERKIYEVAKLNQGSR